MLHITFMLELLNSLVWQQLHDKKNNLPACLKQLAEWILTRETRKAGGKEEREETAALVFMCQKLSAANFLCDLAKMLVAVYNYAR